MTGALADAPAGMAARVELVVIWSGTCAKTAEADKIRIGRSRARNREMEFFMGAARRNYNVFVVYSAGLDEI
jgi:hypothetical protein